MKTQSILRISLLFFVMQMLAIPIYAQFFDHPTKVIDSTNLYVIYKLAWKQDTNDLDYVKNEDMVLFIGNDISKFTSYNQYRFMFEGRKAEREGKLSLFLTEETIKSFRAKLTYKIYKNYPQGRYTFRERVMPTNFEYVESLDVYKWQMTALVDTIGEYVAHCATTDYGGRKWIAWYTTEIPINDGPYKFSGLPGLIIKLYDEQEHYVFELDRIERSEETIEIEYDNRDWVKTNRNDFLKAAENFRNDIINRAKEAGMSSSAQQKAARNMLKRNNPIEF
ncbi:MAG: GLPGLI family protein [Bacteroidales bacterium]|jgi:GLPGLI family protein|nr:GLPGLI family protein [Bacteroidales bacterium]